MRSAFLVVLAARVALAAPSPGPELALDAPLFTAALGDQDAAAVAFGGSTYLAVWREGDPVANLWSIVGSRLAADGTALDVPPILISNVGGQLQNPAVAFDGTRFLVAWEGPALSLLGIWGAYVDVNGAVTPRFAIAGSTSLRPSVGGGNNLGLVAWGDANLGLLHAQLYNQTGALVRSDFVIQPSPMPVGAFDSQPAVVSGSAAAGFLVSWTRFVTGTPSLHAARVAPDGSVDPEFALNSNALSFVTGQQVANDGTQWFAIWLNSDDYNLYGRAIPYASPPPLADYVVATPLVNPYSDEAVVGLGNGGLLAIWEDCDTVPTCALWGERLDAAGNLNPADGAGSGVVIASDPRALPYLLPTGGDSARTPLATDGTRAVAVWVRRGAGLTGEDVMSLLVDPTIPSPSPLAQRASQVISLGESFEVTRSVASDGQGFLVVWEDDRAASVSGSDIYGMRLHLDGTADGAPFIICDAPGNQILPSVAASGGDYLVAWADGRSFTSPSPGPDLDIYAGRVGMSGGPKDGNGFLVSKQGGPDANAQIYPAVAARPGGWLVAWEDWRRSTPTIPARPLPGIWSVTVATDGSVGAEAAVSDPVADLAKTACSPAAAWDGMHYFVAYEQPCGRLHDIYPVPPPLADLAGNWIAADGTVDPSRVALAVLAGAETQPALAAMGGGIAMVWHDQTGGELIRAGLLADQGSTLTAATLASGVGAREAPTVAAAGNTLLFTWIENGVQAARAIDAPANLEAPFPITGNPVLQVAPPNVNPPLDGNKLVAARESTPPVALAAAASGEMVAVYNFIDPAGVPRLRARKLAVLTQGTACIGTGGCESGICTGGVCCNTSCDGVCQACGVNGCDQTPATDPRCAGPSGLVSCKQLSTQCRTFTDVPLAACLDFGQCGVPGDPSQCSQFVDADGSDCASEACGGAGTCMAGQCVCTSEPSYTFPVRAAPPASGCDVGSGGGMGGLWMLLPLLLLWRRRALLLLLVGCTSTPPSLQLTLRMQDAVFAPAQVVRLVISPTDGTMFHETAVVQVKRGLLVSNYDYDGNGSVDIVVEVAPDYPLEKVTHLQLEPDSLAQMTQVTVRAEVFDGLGNRFARDQVAAVLTPGQVTHAPDLSPGCVNNCPDATVQLAAAQAETATIFPGRELTALAAGNLSGAMPRHADVVVSSAHQDLPGLRNAGQVYVLFGGGQSFAAQPDVTLDGPSAGAQLGTALVVGDVNGDGKDDIVAGAPGAANTAGSLYIAFGPPGSFSMHFDGAAVGERLGAALALADFDGDGVLDIIAGAPGSDSVYVYGLAGGQMKRQLGPALSGFGAALAASGGTIAISAPLEDQKGAVYTTTSFADMARLAGEGGGFGSALQLFDLDGDGTLELAVGAPGEGAVYVVPAALGVTLDQSLARLRGDPSFGDALGRVRWPHGDALVVGANAAHNGGGAAFVVRGQTLTAAPSLKLDATGHPAAVALSGENLGAGLGAHLLVDDFDGDGFADLLAAGSGDITFYVEKGPLL